MENRRVLPPLNIEKAIDPKYVRTTTPEEDAKISDAIARRKKFDEGKAAAQGKYKQVLKEGAMKRSYTIDEMTVATLLKGHPDAHEIVDNLFKGKEKNESGEEFQDGSEDTIGGEGHAAVARPDSIKHEGKPSGIGPNEPGTGTKKASVEDGDLEKSEGEGEDVEKSDNLADNLPDEFEDEMEDDDTIPAEKNAEKSLTIDEEVLDHLVKTMGPERFEEAVKAVIGGRNLDPGQVSSVMRGSPQAGHLSGGPAPEVKARAAEEKMKMKDTALRSLTSKVGTGGATKSEESDLEKSEENMGEDYSLNFSKSILERMGLQKGATSVSKEAGGGKATQINYGTKPTTRFKHPKAKSDKKYIHNPAKGTVTVEKEGEKTKEYGVSDEKKLKNASVNSADLYKALDAILEKKTVA